MSLLRSLLYTLLFYAGSTPIVVIGALISLVWPPAIQRTARMWADYVWWLTHNILRIKVVIRGVVPQHAVIVAAKHQSAFETMATLHIWDNPAVAMKAELMRFPVWGYLARRHGSIPVDREASTRAMREMMRASEAAVAQGRPIIIFPEGTRIPVGEAPPLKPGVAGIYRLLKLPVVPVALDAGTLWPAGSFIKRPGTITLSIGAEIPAGLKRDALLLRLHAAINQDPTA